jgi:hypothetical protein
MYKDALKQEHNERLRSSIDGLRQEESHCSDVSGSKSTCLQRDDMEREGKEEE